MICQACGIEAPTRNVAFHQNIGALVVHFTKSVKGQMCKSCIHKNFWGMTGTTAVLGWWGTISLIITPFFLLNNIGRYLLCVTMQPVPPGAAPPELTEAEAARIMPHATDLFDRLNAGEDFHTAAARTAELADVTPGQVALFVQAIVQSQSESS